MIISKLQMKKFEFFNVILKRKERNEKEENLSPLLSFQQEERSCGPEGCTASLASSRLVSSRLLRRSNLPVRVACCAVSSNSVSISLIFSQATHLQPPHGMN